MNTTIGHGGAALALSLSLSVMAQTTHDHNTHQDVPAAAASAAQSAEAVQLWSQGEVRRIDLAARKITLKHGPIAVLGMDPMTMVFQLRDDAAFKAAQSLKIGERIEFEAAYDKGAYLVTRIRPVQPTAGAQSPR